jgi:hypothetical protein
MRISRRMPPPLRCVRKGLDSDPAALLTSSNRSAGKQPLFRTEDPLTSAHQQPHTIVSLQIFPPTRTVTRPSPLASSPADASLSSKCVRYLAPKRLNTWSGILWTSWYVLVGVPVVPVPLTQSRTTHISRAFTSCCPSPINICL